MDVRRLLMLICEGWFLKTNLRRGAAFALGPEIALRMTRTRRAHQ